MERNPKILVVDDDPRLRDLLRRYLGENGFQVFVSENGAAMSRLWVREHFDALILDLMMPGEDGLQILRRLRAAKDMTPVIMLTAAARTSTASSASSSAQTTTSPSPSIRASCSPASTPCFAAVPQATRPARLRWKTKRSASANSELDLGTRVLKKNGEVQPLTTGEFAVLKAFARHPRQPLSRDKLMEMARGREYEAFDRSLDVQVSRLRKLIEPDPSKPRYLQTVWGLGYVFIPDGHN